MANMYYEFKLAAFIDNKDRITRVPNFGLLDLTKIAVIGGIKRTFNSNTSKLHKGTENVLSLGGEIQDMLKHKNLKMLRNADRYSNDFLIAHANKSELIALISFRSFMRAKSGRRLITSALLVAKRAKVTSFVPYSYGNSRVEYIDMKFRDPVISYSDPTIILEQIMQMIKMGKGFVEKTLDGLNV